MDPSVSLNYMSLFLTIVLLGILPFQFVLPLPNGFDIPLARLLAALVICTFLIERLFRRRFSFSPLAFATLSSFLLWVGVSLFWSPRLDLALPKVAFLFNLLPLFLVWQWYAGERVLALRLVRIFLWGATTAAIISLLIFFTQFFLGAGTTFHFLIEQVLPFFLGRELASIVAHYPSLLVNIGGVTWLRATAFFPDPHVASFFFGMSGFLALGFSQLGKTDPRTFSMAGILFLADLLTFSRGGYLGLIVGGIAYLALIEQPFRTFSVKRRILHILFLPLLIVMLAAPVISRLVTSFTLNDASSIERLILWTSALETIGENPVFGTGIGNYLSSVHPLASSTTPFYAHNLFLDLGLELGVIGCIFFLSFFFSTAASVWKRKDRDSLTVGIFAALLLYLTHSFFETALFSVHVTILLVFLFALIAGLRKTNLLQSNHETHYRNTR